MLIIGVGIRTYIGIFELTYLYSKLQYLKSNLDRIWQIEYGDNIAIFDIKTLNFEYMVRRSTPQISNIAINSLNLISDMPCIFEFKELNIEFSKFIAIFDI